MKRLCHYFRLICLTRFSDDEIRESIFQKLLNNVKVVPHSEDENAPYIKLFSKDLGNNKLGLSISTYLFVLCYARPGFLLQ